MLMLRCQQLIPEKGKIDRLFSHESFAMSRQRYRKNKDQIVTAVQLSLDTEGFSYTKWGAEQRCRAGDWLVENNGECYTVNQQTFQRTYRKVDPGQYVKTTPVWAYPADAAGVVSTQEGSTSYEAGDYIVSNKEDGTDDYAISKNKFESMYELDESN